VTDRLGRSGRINAGNGKLERRLPAVEPGALPHQIRSRQARSRQRLSERSELLVRCPPARRLKEHVGRARTLEELLDESRLADLPAALDED